MPVPKRKTSKARRDKRSSNNSKMKATGIAVCSTCQAPVLPHQVCKECGHYKGVKVLRTKADRMYERTQARQSREEVAKAKPVEHSAQSSEKK
jgi:large subunit ribosomal protein L32